MKERMSCNLCQGTEGTFLLEKEGYSIVKCNKCSLIFAKLVKPIDYINLYSANYFNVEGTKGGIGYRNYLADKKAYQLYFQKKLLQILHYKKKGNFLDIGCALGFLLNLAQKKGYKVSGLDVSKYAVKFIRRKLGTKVYLGQLQQMKLPANYFDIITSFESMEHVENPLGFLREIKRILKPGGYFFATTPNQKGIWPKIMGKRWFSYKPPEHLYYFDFQTIKKMVERAGLEVVEVKRDIFRGFPLYHLIERFGYYYPILQRISRIFLWFIKKLHWDKINIPIYLGQIWLVAKKEAKREIPPVITQVPIDYFEEKKQNFWQKLWHEKKMRVIIEAIGPPRFEKGLDVGCASGDLTEKIRKATVKNQFWGVDIYDKAIKYGQKKYPRLNLTIADGQNLPFRGDFFDLIICADTLEHFSRPEKFLQEAHRVLKGDGRIIIAGAMENWLFRLIWFFWQKGKGKVWQNSHLHHFINKKIIVTILKTANFKIEKIIISHWGMNVTFLAKKSSIEKRENIIYNKINR